MTECKKLLEQLREIIAKYDDPAYALFKMRVAYVDGPEIKATAEGTVREIFALSLIKQPVFAWRGPSDHDTLLANRLLDRAKMLLQEYDDAEAISASTSILTPRTLH